MGKLICFDADSGKVVWQKDLVKEYEAKTPVWGYSTHPYRRHPQVKLFSLEYWLRISTNTVIWVYTGAGDLDETTNKLLRLLDKHGERLYALLVKLTFNEDAADDLLQDLFLRLNASRGFARAENPDGYLFRTAINLAFDWRKRRSPSGTIEDLPGETPEPVDTLGRQEEIAIVLSAMSNLPESSRQLLTMRFIEELPYDDLAERLESTPHRVRALCSKAIAQLRKLVNLSLDQPQEKPHV